MPPKHILPNLLFLFSSVCSISFAEDPFRQLDELWPTPNSIRRASGAPGPDYWQQKVDYVIKASIDQEQQILTGSETITYHNNSPDQLTFLWLQLDQNRFALDSDEYLSENAPSLGGMSYAQLQSIMYRRSFPGGHQVTAVTDAENKPLEHHITGTMLRVALPYPLASGQAFTFKVDWHYRIVDCRQMRARGGFEYFKEDKNYLFAIAQWYPRLCAYTDYGGWQNKQTTGQEFGLEFGDFEVSITVPDNHIVASTGELQNADEVLTEVQRSRLHAAKSAEKPVFIVTLDEAKANETTKPMATKTWTFKASKVRDFSFASSPKFLWDAQGFDLNGRKIMAMSYWPKEGEPLWSKYSTASVIHAVKSYSKFTFDFPYPKMLSVNAPISGMEYPMITFQSPRPEKDGTYPERTKYRLIGVIIHEVGHNWFPMVVNSDERQWRWMDEGLNTFVQLLAEQEWEEAYPSSIISKTRRQGLLNYMQSSRSRPIMSAPEVLIDGGYNAYSKPTLALSILRETILGRETFDFAFKQYAQRWMFKRPQPYDFFRTMEEAAGRDLDWFWRTWFYETDHVDVSVENVVKYRLDTKNPEIEKPLKKTKDEAKPMLPIVKGNLEIPKNTDGRDDLVDFYSTYDEYQVLPKEKEAFEKLLKDLEPEEKELLETKFNFYLVSFKNVGGIITPVPLTIHYEDDSTETLRMPAEMWRYDARNVKKFLITEKAITSVVIDPEDEIADVDKDNNRFPRAIGDAEFELKKSPEEKNPMQQLLKKEEEGSEKEEGEE